MAATPALRTAEDFNGWFAEKQAQGQGYAEVGSDASGYPFLAFSFRDTRAVVHWFTSPDQVLLLVGDAVVDADESLDFPVQEGLCAFTGRFISEVARARCVVTGVLSQCSTDALGCWEPL